MAPAKVIVRIRGGLGNQIFCYAAARRLAVANDAELVIDNVTGFTRDHLYRRKYSLDVFNLSARKATSTERMEPFERLRRGMAKFLSSRKAFEGRNYLVEERPDFDERLLDLKVRRAVYLDGLWQAEGYFKDIEDTIRRDLTFKAPTDDVNRNLSERMQMPNAVSLHVRCFDTGQAPGTNNMTGRYYEAAIQRMESIDPAAHYFVFSDRPEQVSDTLGLPKNRLTIVSHNQDDDNAYADMWLMTKCSKHIIANSTFSWWGAWLSGASQKVVICPGPDSMKSNWTFKGLLPREWIKVS